ncbi:MAG: hypothetical protein GWO20_16345 [Candidatus Korarchaeota archaeon]|nr:hypothetical protein [Candidatus Korarchaeota archaeon]NIU84982.1 hypothetical protein [Candidatus Thorarchaeota archaeon]NIW15004.1 hypothetical protein [Candidatus Thorarchaeota archaeon]NIW53014.1 hypothetical protein [Candidatus Korarchaeota archaeon]
MVSYTIMLSEIEKKIESTEKALQSIGYSVGAVSAREFYDYLTGETFTRDTTTVADVVGNEYLMVHELVEINELKQKGRIIDKRVVVDSPKTVIYDAHFTAIGNRTGVRVAQERLLLDQNPITAT